MTKVELSNIAFIVRSYANNPNRQVIDCALNKEFIPQNGSEEYVNFLKDFEKNPKKWVKYFLG